VPSGYAMTRITAFGIFDGYLYATLVSALTEYGAIYRSSNNGLTWSLVVETTEKYPLGVFVDDNSLYVNFTKGIVSISSDGTSFIDVPVYGTYPSTGSVYSITKAGDCFIFLLRDNILVTTCDFVKFNYIELTGSGTRILYNFVINISGDLVFASINSGSEPFILRGFLTNYLSDNRTIIGNKFGAVSFSNDGAYCSNTTTLYQGIYRNNLIIRDNYNRISQALLAKSQGYGGRLLLYDANGTPSADIRGYSLSGVQAYLASGALVIGGTNVVGSETLTVYGNIFSSGNIIANTCDIATANVDNVIINYDALPTVDPLVKGKLWRIGTALQISAG
jgi:hypothetical protein